MSPLKRLVRAAVSSALSLVAWSATDEERALALARAELMEAAIENEEDDDHFVVVTEELERDAAYLTTGLITAVREVHKAHEEGKDCSPHHDAAGSLLTGIDNPITAIRIIQHLLEIVAANVDDEDIQQMVATIVATELGDDDEDDPRHHHH